MSPNNDFKIKQFQYDLCKDLQVYITYVTYAKLVLLVLVTAGTGSKNYYFD